MKNIKVIAFFTTCLASIAVITLCFYNFPYMRRGEEFGLIHLAMSFLMILLAAPFIWKFIKENLPGK